ncbi:response regulator [Thermodesulfobacteriota bacterium]
MPVDDILKGKRVLIVDDEPDILETLEELLDMCLIDKAPNFETAKKFLDKNHYDAAILDIMGVRGYDLLELTTDKKIPTLMLTAHALSPDNLIKSIKEGAQSYIPKDRISELTSFLRGVLEAHQLGDQQQAAWFARLKPFFDKKFGPGWRKKDKDFWQDFDNKFIPTKDEIEEVL